MEAVLQSLSQSEHSVQTLVVFKVAAKKMARQRDLEKLDKDMDRAWKRIETLEKEQDEQRKNNADVSNASFEPDARGS